MIHGERCVSERRDPVGISPGPCLTTSLVEACSLMAHVKLHIPGPVEVSPQTFAALCHPMIGCLLYTSPSPRD